MKTFGQNGRGGFECRICGRDYPHLEDARYCARSCWQKRQATKNALADVDRLLADLDAMQGTPDSGPMETAVRLPEGWRMIK